MEQSQVQEKSPDHQRMRIYTIGHGDMQVDEFLDLLSWHGITHLVDVRPVAVAAAQADFQAENLRVEVLVRGIMYASMSSSLGLGTALNAEDWERLLEVEAYVHGLQKLIQISMLVDRVVAIMGVESAPEKCLRATQIGQSLSALRCDVRHIQGHEVFSQEEVMHRIEVPPAARMDARPI